MAMKITDKHKIAAKLVAAGELQQNEIAKTVGVARQTLISWKHKPEFQKLIESYSLPLEDTEGKERELLDQAYITLHKIMKNGTNESARVNAAKYVVDTFRRKAVKTEKPSVGTDMATILRLVDEK